MKVLLAIAALALASCTREDYLSSAESYFKGKQIHQLEDRDEFLVREDDGSVILYDVEIGSSKGIDRVESKHTVLPATDPWAGFVEPFPK